MDPCDVYLHWEDEDFDQFGALQELVDEALAEWGFDGVDFVNGPGPVGERAAEYDDGTIYLNMDDPDYADVWDDPADSMTHAYHEAMHAMLDQAGLSTGGDLFGEEWEAGFLGSRAADEALEGCQCGEPAESGGDAPPFPWRCDLDDNFTL
jgi:hypothetical protein